MSKENNITDGTFASTRKYFSGQPPLRFGHPIRKPLPQWLNYIKPFGHEYNNFFLNQFRGKPRNNFFKESPSRINHELYGSVSTQSLKNYSDNPFERPMFFLLNPHYPQSHWWWNEKMDYTYISKPHTSTGFYLWLVLSYSWRTPISKKWYNLFLVVHARFFKNITVDIGRCRVLLLLQPRQSKQIRHH